MSAELELRLRPEAEADLRDIWVYSTEQWGAAQAERYLDGLERAFGVICVMPEIARERGEFQPPVRIHPHGEHLVVYLVGEGFVDVVRVLATRQDWRRALE